MCFTPPHPKPIQSLGWLFLVDEGGSQPGIYMPGSWRRCAPLPLHHCISHFSTLAHNGAKLVIVTTQEPTPIPQKGEMRKVVADYFVRRFPWKTPNQWPETSMWKWHNISIGIIWMLAKVSLSMGFGPRKTCKKPMRIHPYATSSTDCLMSFFFKWWWRGNILLNLELFTFGNVFFF